MQLVKYREDWRSILFVAVCFGLLAAPYYLELPTMLIPIWIFSTGMFCFCVCVINHNHVHQSIFNTPIFNRLFGIVLTLVKGHTSSGVIQAHNLNHHVHNGQQKDWIRPALAGKSSGLMRLVSYIFNSSVAMANGRRNERNQGLPSAVISQIRLERIILLIAILALVVIDLHTFALYVLTPWIIGVVMLVGVNLLQHDQCVFDSKYDHSRNFTGKLGNWFFFNNGYHTAHHNNPALHWSRLPDFHNNHIGQHIDTRLEKKSILKFLFENYFPFT
jgi:fatty acid desaturase